MHYTMLIYEGPAEFARRTDPAERDEYWRPMPAFFQALRDAGVYVSGAGLEPPETATTLSLHDGRRQVQDGPFAEAKEQLAGCVVLDVPSREAAIDWAARFPHAERKAFEIRPNLPPMR